MEELFPNAATELANWKTPFQFLVCIVLSAQTTDKGVNKVTTMLFEEYPDPLSMSKAREQDVYSIIQTVNYSNSKSRYLIELSRKLVQDFNSEVPKDVNNLITLKGVGRKTANVFLNDLYKSNEGVAVDTHVMRVSQRLGLTKETNPDKIARDLEKLYPQKDWWKINRYFVLYGRYICRAKMKKTRCVFRDICSYCKGLPIE
ncbi:MAG: Endonuclease III [candidate division WS6 bacterium GW2011_GWF2_39_15]|uniref:Endonuclease III n=1 Tax=candidate division WS6 bacterium GW2011_GWF2_39_15 TaxID=1619100 RepID=A0A0G0N0Q5_9BACT|nr:MAG: Endonuclease III [candidate division WS6 bacterium GW2011_GWF2_39_15]